MDSQRRNLQKGLYQQAHPPLHNTLRTNDHFREVFLGCAQSAPDNQTKKEKQTTHSHKLAFQHLFAQFLQLLPVIYLKNRMGLDKWKTFTSTLKKEIEENPIHCVIRKWIRKTQGHYQELPISWPRYGPLNCCVWPLASYRFLWASMYSSPEGGGGSWGLTEVFPSILQQRRELQVA